ncbi:MAG TPA: calcium/sodium antiporter [Candidatus Nanoarchaeia archaeon]|nr:calcium/sodium antiporter [Candidatus Nanoarchaeia archaeon]
MEPFTAVLVFIASVFLLVKGAAWLIDNSSAIGRYLEISPIIIGLTIVAIGTSLPEFFVGIFAVLGGTADISVGNIVGSNIANIGLILGIASIIYPLTIREKTLINEFPFLLISGFMLLVLANDNNIFGRDTFIISRFDGFLFLLTFLFFISYLYRSMKFEHSRKKVEEEFKEEFGKKSKEIWKNAGMIALGIASLGLGGKLIVNSGVDIASALGVSEKFIGLTIVSLGTTLPELFTSVIAAIKKEADIAVGNILGSYIFNILFVLGVIGVVRPYAAAPSLVYFDMVMMIAITFMLLTFGVTKRRIDRHEGVILLVSYLAYITYLVWTV